jgi:hypothetical protein
MADATWIPSTRELVVLGAPFRLRDGARVRVRQIRAGDKELLRRGFERLSDLTEVDHHDHEAIVALDEATGEGVGVARYVRNGERADVAEVAVAVVDDWHGPVPIPEVGLSPVLRKLLRIAARNGAPPPPGLARADRTRG